MSRKRVVAWLTCFEFLAVVIFLPDIALRGAVVAPYAGMWEVVAQQAYNRVSYARACGIDEEPPNQPLQQTAAAILSSSAK